MKKHILFIAVSLLMLGACTSSTKPNEKDAKLKTAAPDSTQTFNLDTTKLATGTVYYQCPMTEDADIISDKPGTCPRCAMELEPITKR